MYAFPELLFWRILKLIIIGAAFFLVSLLIHCFLACLPLELSISIPRPAVPSHSPPPHA